MAVRLDTRERVHAEDKKFNKFWQTYPSSAPTKFEHILAVEVNDQRNYLYTLTESALYREDISDPTNPTGMRWIPLRDHVCDLPPGEDCLFPSIHFPDWEEMRDIKVWNHPDPNNANQGKIILLTTKRIVVIKDKDSLIEIKSYAGDLLDQGQFGTLYATAGLDWQIGNINALGVSDFERLRIADDGFGLKAYVSAGIGTRAIGNGRTASLILVCDLDSANGFWNPTFDNGSSTTGTVYKYWSPFDHASPPIVPPPSAAATWNQLATVYSFDVREDPSTSSTILYAACGSLAQVQRIDVTNWFANGTQNVIPPVQQIVIDPNEHIRNVLADPDHADRIFTARESAFSINNDSILGGSVLRHTVNEPNSRKGAERDLAYVTSMGNGVSAAVWTGGIGKVDYVCKVLDVTEAQDHLTVPPPVALVDEYPGISSSDGAVYLGGEIYLPTFGGVLRYTFDSMTQKWQSVPSSYASAEEGLPGSGIARNTEHIAAGFVDTSNRVFTAPADGSFMEYVIGFQKEPKANTLIGPDTSILPHNTSETWSAWQGAEWDGYWPGWMYGNDVEFVRIGSEDYVLTIVTNFGIFDPAFSNPRQRHSQHAILAYRWDLTAPGWEHVASVASGLGNLYPESAIARLAHTISISEGDPGKYFAFVGHKEGFFSVDLSGLASQPYQMSLATEHLSANIGGIVASHDRLFVYSNTGPAELSIHALDTATGAFTIPAVTTYYANDPPPSLGGTGVLRFSPGRAFRARFFETPGGSNGEGHLTLACEPGLIFKLAWPGPGGAGVAPEDSLGVADYWLSDYTFAMQDCRVYDFSAQYPGDPLKILAVKDSESFSVVDF